ncbi:MAG: hypothetical protein E7561_03340 [Ruminococcaceae bacterium]|nr:hypothetical protein [Oscillospiraceae bacterium]
MITVSPEKDKQRIKELFLENDLEFLENSCAVIALCDDEVLGCCLYDLYEESDRKIVVHKVFPDSDIMLADGILRSALHVAAERSIMDAFYSDSAPKELFLKLGFIKSEPEKRLDIDKLFGGCNCSK